MKVLLMTMILATMLVGCGNSVATGGNAETGGSTETNGSTKITGTDTGTGEHKEVEAAVGDSNTESGEPKEVIRSVKAIQYSEAGNIVNWSEREYNSDGQEVKYTFGKFSVDSVTRWEEYEYNATGGLVKDIAYNPDGSVYAMAEADNGIFFLWNVPADSVEEYNDAGQPMKFFGSCEIEYDSAGRTVKYTAYGSDSNVELWYERESMMLRGTPRNGYFILRMTLN